MNSPFTGGRAILKSERQSFIFRKEEVFIDYQFYVCEDTGSEFSNAELEDQQIKKIHQAYREKCGIPSQEKIKDIRNKYEISAALMSKLLGFGANQYRKYEAGEIPSISNGRMIALIEDISNFKKIFSEAKGILTEREAKTISDRIANLDRGECCDQNH